MADRRQWVIDGLERGAKVIAWRWMPPILLLSACAGPSAPLREVPLPLGGGRPLLAALGSAAVDLPHGGTKPAEGPVLGTVTTKERESEIRQALGQMWGILSSVEAVEAEVEFTFWTNRGALTMVAWRRGADSGEVAESVDPETFFRALSRNFTTFVGAGTRSLNVVFRREPRHWRLSELRSTDTLTSAPLEAKTLPVDAPPIPAGVFAELENEARRRWLPLLKAPSDGTATLELKVDFEDERLVGSSPGGYHATGRGTFVTTPPGFETRIAAALLPFSQGLGHRSVKVVLQAARSVRESSPRWRVVTAATVRPEAGEPQEQGTSFAEYRLLHEEIMRRWREEVHDSAVLAASFTAEQVAWWIVGAWAARGAGVLLKAVSTPLARVLGRGGVGAAGWLECLIARMPAPERQTLSRLWARVETQGLEALSAAERTELRVAFQRLEQLAAAPLTMGEKGILREIARAKFWAHLEKLDPKLAAKLVFEGKLYPVHHRFPLAFAHLAVETDINAVANLVAVGPEVHISINRLWAGFRPGGARMTRTSILEMVAIVDRHFGRWYNAPYDSLLLRTELRVAEDAARAEMELLLVRLESLR